MKRWIAWSLCAVMLVMFSGCRSAAARANQAGADGDDGRLKVVATIFPQYDFVREIAGDSVNLTMLLPLGSESHSFEPSPQDIITIQSSDVFIYVGGETDQWVHSVLKSMDTEGMTLIALTDLVDVVEEEIVEGMEGGHSHDDEDHDDGHEDEDHGHDEEYDEHVWTSPRNAMTIVQALSDTLCSLDSGNAGQYRENTADYLERLDELDQTFREITQAARYKTLVFGDRFPFRYFADAYGLDYYAAFPGCSTETDASPATIAFLIDKVREEKLPVVFYMEFNNGKMADAICESTGAQKMQLHSCHNISKQDFDDGKGYLSLMLENAALLREALC